MHLSNLLRVSAAMAPLASEAVVDVRTSILRRPWTATDDDDDYDYRAARTSITAAGAIDRRLRRREEEIRDGGGGGRRPRGGEGGASASPADDGSSSSSSSSPEEEEEEVVVKGATPDLKIIGGVEPSTPTRYPYLASLTYFGGSHICGGSLVAKDMVLTAAHCAGYASTVELGRPDLTVPHDPSINERIEVAYEIKHPEWDPVTVDNDFMLLKLARSSEYFPMIRLNDDPNVPAMGGEKVTIVGFGDTNPDPDVNEPSDTLLEVTLDYVPDDECRSKSGETGGGEVDYSSKITGNMMCAMDGDGGRGDVPVDEDTCTGDSGGPMILLKSATTNEDVQVGIVSWGIGCASPLFPGVYSRVSSQYQWIRETVCRHSRMAPDSFVCDEGSINGTGFSLDEEIEFEGKPYVTLEVSLDEQPEEFSWTLSSLSGPSGVQMIATVPPGFYSGYSNYTFHHKLQLNADQFYRISLRDSFGDGMKGYVAMYRGKALLSNLIMMERNFHDEARTDFKRLDHAIYTGENPPSFFTLAIKFDKFPMDLSWTLESITDSVIMMQRPVGWYNERFEQMSIVEKIPVFGARPTTEYRFTIRDTYTCDSDPTQTCGDGICCNYGDGQYQLFAGDVGDNKTLASGGEFEKVDSVLVSLPTEAVSL